MAIQNMPRPMDTIKTLILSAHTFFLTGSRFFNTATIWSDWDFYTQDSPEIREWLTFNGFQPINPDFDSKASKYGDDPNIAVVYGNGRVTSTVQVQLVKDAALKTQAQSLLFQMPRMAFDLFTDASRNKKAHDWWKWAYTVIEGMAPRTPQYSKLHTIKDVRNTANIGLKEAKVAVEICENVMLGKNNVV